MTGSSFEITAPTIVCGKLVRSRQNVLTDDIVCNPFVLRCLNGAHLPVGAFHIQRKQKLPKTVAFLKSVLDSEVAEAANRIGYKTRATAGLLDRMEKKYPGSKFAVLKGINMLKRLG